MQGKDAEQRKILELVLKIIELDERIDKFYADEGVKCDGRPHEWRSKHLKLIEQKIHERIEGCQIDDRSMHQNWVTRYLEICRTFIVKDLYAAKNFLQIFPPEHQLYDRFVMYYHAGISRKIREIANSDMDKREISQLLHWIRSYSGDQVLGMPFLQINAEELLLDHPLLPQESYDFLIMKFIEVTKQEAGDWARKAVEQEFTRIFDGENDVFETDGSNCYYTQLPYLLFSIINDQVSLAAEVSLLIVPQILDVCLMEFIKAAKLFEDSIIEYKNKTYDDKERMLHFTKTMIVIANNLDMCSASAESLKSYTTTTENIVGEQRTSGTVAPIQPITVYSSRSNASPCRSPRSFGLQRESSPTSIQSALKGAVETIREIAEVIPLTDSSENSEDNQRFSYRRSSTCELSKYHNKRRSSEIPQSNRRLSAVVGVESNCINPNEKIEILRKKFESMRQMVVSTLFYEICDDLVEFFERLLTKEWLKNGASVDVICMTILDYYADYKHLRPKIRYELVKRIQLKFVAEYLAGIKNRKMTCINYNKRCSLAERLKSDVDTINETMVPLLKELNDDDEEPNPSDVLVSIADFIMLKDKNLVALEAASFAKTYPDISIELLFTIIDIRDDMTSTESRKIAEDVMKISKIRESNPMYAKLFEMAKKERKVSNIMKDVVPRLRRRVRYSIA
ncbi:hypothetical protein AB6A40_000040 [Gnathostoma spinigerum]|uniref:Exocyst complex component Sec6 n=1 Tax=Gnathostoma spinigerum TaxID=75299 RepID=A0ABD6E7I2_9BILA